MKIFKRLIPVVCALALVALAQQSGEETKPPADPPPYWAFTVDPPEKGNSTKPADTAPRHIHNSKQSFRLAQIADLFSAPDWHPEAHPTMPQVVAHGHKPDLYACGYCHLPNGQGRPENASLAGLPVEYIAEQMAAFQSGARKTSQTGLLPVINMVDVAQHADSGQVRAAAEYFSSLKPKPWIHVVESPRVSKTHTSGWMLVPDEPYVPEPIGQRIIEVPRNVTLTELRDDTSGFIAYVPNGSVKKGKKLVMTGGQGKTLPCATCHGDDLRGKDNVPAIAGRSPSYIVRQLYDMQHGARGGAGAQLMQSPVAKLSLDDMLEIAAYLGSLQP